MEPSGCLPALITLKDSLSSGDLTDAEEIYIYKLRLLGCNLWWLYGAKWWWWKKKIMGQSSREKLRYNQVLIP